MGTYRIAVVLRKNHRHELAPAGQIGSDQIDQIRLVILLRRLKEMGRTEKIAAVCHWWWPESRGPCDGLLLGSLAWKSLTYMDAFS